MRWSLQLLTLILVNVHCYSQLLHSLSFGSCKHWTFELCQILSYDKLQLLLANGAPGPGTPSSKVPAVWNPPSVSGQSSHMATAMNPILPIVDSSVHGMVLKVFNPANKKECKTTPSKIYAWILWTSSYCKSVWWECNTWRDWLLWPGYEALDTQ